MTVYSMSPSTGYLQTEFVNLPPNYQRNEYCSCYLAECICFAPKEDYFPAYNRATPYPAASPVPWNAYVDMSKMSPVSPGIQYWNASPPPFNPVHQRMSTNPGQLYSYDVAPVLMSTKPRSQSAQDRFPAAQNVEYSPGLSMKWRTSPCKHFVRYAGWCPAGDNCAFIHDLALPLPRRRRRGSPIAHCWSHIQGRCQLPEHGCTHYHPQDVEPYKKHTPCWNWLACPDIASCPFKHPPILPPYIPYIESSIPAPMEINGTTYFPIPVGPAAPPYIKSPQQNGHQPSTHYATQPSSRGTAEFKQTSQQPVAPTSHELPGQVCLVDTINKPLADDLTARKKRVHTQTGDFSFRSAITNLQRAGHVPRIRILRQSM